MFVTTVKENKSNKNKIAFIPKNIDIKPGDTILIKKLDIEKIWGE